ncbi:spike base protein, RCAP_Rcc01079 family [Acuticoccus mangrovi]|uniref:Uncharacterized protein n=1 Tax=Acuticoccus mangrovi TaxID=2796142 RepID=A0A934MF46_9HYPH|nr:hypothetical protein [Acuticoccus mangrovi]MBJ3775078.1 hypothetical protein [Acuticoccus mangrovi]
MPAQDPFQLYQRGASAPAADAFSITPNDGTDLATAARAIYVGGGGDLAVVTLGGTSITFVSVAAGSVLPCSVARVLATNTTATDIVGLV